MTRPITVIYVQSLDSSYLLLTIFDFPFQVHNEEKNEMKPFVQGVTNTGETTRTIGDGYTRVEDGP